MTRPIRRHVLDLARWHFPDVDPHRLLPLYELQIALGELQYAAFRKDAAGMDGAAGRLERLNAGGGRRSQERATSTRLRDRRGRVRGTRGRCGIASGSWRGVRRGV